MPGYSIIYVITAYICRKTRSHSSLCILLLLPFLKDNVIASGDAAALKFSKQRARREATPEPRAFKSRTEAGGSNVDYVVLMITYAGRSVMGEALFR